VARHGIAGLALQRTDETLTLQLAGEGRFLSRNLLLRQNLHELSLSVPVADSLPN
jgi:hypothetical protein